MKKIIICLITVLMLFATIGCSNQYEGLTKIENELFEVYIPDTYNEQKKDGYDYVGYDENTSFIVLLTDKSLIVRFIGNVEFSDNCIDAPINISNF